MKTIVNVPTKQSLIRETRDYLMIALGLILYGIGWTVFLLPNDITTGRSAGYRLHSLFRHRLPCAVHLFQYQPHPVTTPPSAFWAGSSVSKQYSLYSP